MIQNSFRVISVEESSEKPFNFFSASGICLVIYFISRQASVWRERWHKKTAQFISQFSKVTSNLQTALISKRFDPPGWDWSQLKDFYRLKMAEKPPKRRKLEGF